MMTTSAAVKSHMFSITVTGLTKLDPGLDDAAWSARMNDLLDDLTGRALAAGLEEAGMVGVGSRGEVFALAFEVAAGSLGDAVGSAIKDVQRAGFRVASVEMEEARKAD